MFKSEFRMALQDAFVRLRPYLAVFFAVQLLVRLTLWARVVGDTGSALNVLSAFGVGAAMDMVVAACWAIPALLIWAASERNMPHTVWVVIASVVWVFSAFAEHVFWTEFGVRFNFIAVDYLVYTQEVIGNIRESYPMPALLFGVMAVAALLSWWQLRHTPLAVAPRPALRARLAVVACGVAAAAALLMGTSIRMADISTNTYANELARNGTYALFYAYNNNEINYAQFYPTLPADEVHAVLEVELTTPHSRFLHPDDAADTTHHMIPYAPEQRKNVVLVVMESMSAAYMGRFHTAANHPAGLTPNLDRLAAEGLFFSNLYATGTRTVRGLEAVTLSLPPTPGQSIVRRDGNEHLFSIADVFNDRGYHSQFLYGGHGAFDNMNYFFGHNGFEVVDRTDFADNEVHFSNNWGVSDEDLFAKAIQQADGQYAAKKPFFQLLMTTSNHRPYTFPPQWKPAQDMKGRYAGVAYADYAVGKLIEQARSKPWFKDTVFVFVADHTAGSAGKAQIDPRNYHIPLIMWSPGMIAPRDITEMASQIDVAPSLFGLLGFAYESRFFGNDVVHQPHHVQHAYLSTYQKVALMQQDQIVILGPKRMVELEAGGTGEALPAEKLDHPLLQEAIAYYQSAANWRATQQRLPRTVVPQQQAGRIAGLPNAR